jgi:phage-related protein (TIGR01555 family)
MHELNLDIINIKGLSNALAAGQEGQILKRFETYAFAKSLFHMAVLDEEETFSNRVMPASGVTDVIEKFYGLLAAVEDIPATRFLGNSPGGLNATGESDMRNYYDMVKSKQEDDLDPHMWAIDSMLSLSLWGDIPEEIHAYKWNPLWQETQKEQSERELLDAQRDQIYIQNGVITEAHAAKELQHDDVYDIDEEHINDLEEFAAQGEDELEGEINASLESNTPQGTSPTPQAPRP